MVLPFHAKFPQIFRIKSAGRRVVSGSADGKLE